MVLNPQAKAVAATTAPADASATPPATDSQETLQRETILYNLARESGSADDYQAYLEVFPNGLFAVNARKQLERLTQEAQEKQVASVSPVDQPAARLDQPVARTVAPDVIELPVTDVVKAMPSNSETEDRLEFDRAKRVEIQTRLNLAGFKIGSSDGSFGRKTRTAIQAWRHRAAFRDRLFQPAAI